MPRPHLMFATLLASTALLHAPAAGTVPSPSQSEYPSHVAVCPAGDLEYSVRVLDFAGNFIINSIVACDFEGCSGTTFCPPQPDDGYVADTFVIRWLTGTDGRVTFRPRASWSCGPDLLRFFADGVLIGRAAAVSPDQNGDRYVDTMDRTLLQAKLGTADLSGDMNNDQRVDEADEQFLIAHLGHTCPGAVPTRPESWGRIKIRYR